MKSLPYPSPDNATVALPSPSLLTPDLEAKLDEFAHLLAHWSSRINLVADARMDVIRDRHIRDSLQVVPLLPRTNCPIGDLGTGGGFPGLVLAIVAGRPTHLVESDHRKTAFLVEVAARLGLRNVTIHTARIEDAKLPPLRAVTARALAPLNVLLGYAVRLLSPGGWQSSRRASDECRVDRRCGKVEIPGRAVREREQPGRHHSPDH